jgi:glycosyltransferase involved in cell wall biosynthesis
MRPLQICDSDGHGGAARAARRLHRGLLALGQESAMLVREKHTTDPEVFAARLDKSAAARRQRRRLKWIEKYWIKPHRTELSNSCFSLPGFGYDLSQNPQVLDCDVLNLHWVSGFLSPPAVARLQQTGRPLFWTLHDQRAFTGGCHFSAGCRGYETSCARCPQLADDRLELAAAGLRESALSINAQEIVVICPSRWLAACARRSALFAQGTIEIIPNGIETRVFQPLPKAAARRQLGLDPEAIYFLFGADNLQEKRKGIGELRDILKMALAAGSFQALCFGNTRRQMDDFGVPVNCLGRIDDDAQLARIYAAADAFLLPSLEDNLPNTMLEAMACGTPVIGFDIGSLPDAITPQETGLLAPAFDLARFAELIGAFSRDQIGRKRMSENCARLIPDRFTMEIQARRYLELYQRALVGKDRVFAGQSDGRASRLVPPTPEFGRICDALLPLAKRERRAARWKNLKRLIAGGEPEKRTG